MLIAILSNQQKYNLYDKKSTSQHNRITFKKYNKQIHFQRKLNIIFIEDVVSF